MNHRNFERKWRFQPPAGSTLPPVAPPHPSGALLARPDRGRCERVFAPAQETSAAFGLRARRDALRLVAADVLVDLMSFQFVGVSAVRAGAGVRADWFRSSVPYYHISPWSDVRLPAELKHITKRRRRKQP